MKPIPYQEIIEKAFKITWKNKFLWVFGFFIFLGAATSNFNLNPGQTSQVDKQQLETLLSYFQNHIAVAVVISIVVLAVTIVIYVFRILSIVGLIKSISDIEIYKQSSIKNIFSEARTFFWRIALLEIIVSVSAMFILLLLIAPALLLFSYKAYFMAGIVSFFGAAIAIPLTLLAYFLGKFGNIRVVLGNNDLRTSLESAYDLFIKNIKESLLMGFFILILSMLFITSLAFLLVIFAAITALVGGLLYWLFSKTGLIIAIIIVVVAALVGLLVLASAYVAFLQAIWVLFFQQISFIKDKEEKKEVEKIASEEIPAPEAV